MGKELQLSQLEKDIEHPEFWNDSTNAQRVMKTVSSLRDDVESWNSLKNHIHDLIELVQLDDESLREEIESETTKLEADHHRNAGMHCHAPPTMCRGRACERGW